MKHPPGTSRKPQLQVADHISRDVTGGPAAPRQPQRCLSARAGPRLGDQPVRASLHVCCGVSGRRLPCVERGQGPVPEGSQSNWSLHGVGGSTNPGSPGRTSRGVSSPSPPGRSRSISTCCGGRPQPRSSSAHAADTRALAGACSEPITARSAPTASPVVSRHNSPNDRPPGSTKPARFREPAGRPAPGLRPPLGTNHHQPRPALISFDICRAGHNSNGSYRGSRPGLQGSVPARPPGR